VAYFSDLELRRSSREEIEDFSERKIEACFSFWKSSSIFIVALTTRKWVRDMVAPRTPPEDMLLDDVDMTFDKEEDLLSFVEKRVGQINANLNDLERMQDSESIEDFQVHWEKIRNGITTLQNIIKQNYIHLAGGEGKIDNWEEMEIYSMTIPLVERLTEIKDTNTAGL